MANLYNRAVSDVTEEVLELFSDIKEEYAEFDDHELLDIVIDIEKRVLERIEGLDVDEK